MGTRTRAQVVTLARCVGTVVAGVVMAGAAGSVRHAHAAVRYQIGEVYCHAVAAGPRYFHSGVSEAWTSSPSPWPSDDAVHRVLDDLTVEFARFVAEHRDVDSLLSLRCDLVAPPDAAAEMIDTAAYFRGGARTSFSTGERIAVEWTPNFNARLDFILTRKVALVVGNGKYEHIGRLPNPANDAADLSAALDRIGFDVTVLKDADEDAMGDALGAFAAESAGVAVALVYYAGQGVQMNGAHYLIPVDARMESAAAVDRETVALDSVLEATSGARARVVILDASFVSWYDEPHGIQMMDSNMLVAYAGLPGGTINDAGGEEPNNSPYASALMRHLERPGLDLLAMFGGVAADVFHSTSGDQTPVFHSSLTAPVVLHPAVAVPDDPNSVAGDR